MNKKYIIFGKGYYFTTNSCLGGFLFNKKKNKKEGFGFIEFSERKIQTLKRLGLKKY